MDRLLDSGFRRNDGDELPLTPSLIKRGKRRSRRGRWESGVLPRKDRRI